MTAQLRVDVPAAPRARAGQDTLRVCFLSRRYWPAVSGMSAYAENLMRHLVRSGHRVTMVSQYRGDEAGRAVYGGGPPPRERVPAGVEVHALESHGEQVVNDGRPADFEADVVAMTEAVLDQHAREPFDLVHAQYAYPTGLAAVRAARTMRVPVVVSVQGGDGHWVGSCCAGHRDLVRGVFGAASALLIGSPSFAAEVAARHDLDPGRFTVVPGATDPFRFRARTADGALGDPPVLLYHGRIDARKGVFDLLEAVELLLEQGQEVRLLVSGVGPDSAEVARRVEWPILRGRVDLLGAVPYEQAHEIYRRADIFVSPTYAEGFSNTILEAMAGGLPVISTDVVGVRDCVRPDRNGVLVPPADPVALAQAVRRVVSDTGLRSRIRRQARLDVERCWSWPVVADQIVGIYRGVLAADPVVPAVVDPPSEPGCRFRARPHLL